MSASDLATEFAQTLTTLETENRQLQESVQDLMMRAEDIGWTQLLGHNTLEDSGPALELLKEVSEPLRDMAAANPLMKRGAQLRHAYAFGRGIVFSGGMTPQKRNIMDDPYNKSVLFSVGGYETMNLALYTDGNFFLIYDEREKLFTVVPLVQITAVVTDPDDASKIRYLRRSWTSNGTAKNVWFPLNKYKARVGAKINKTIKPSSGPAEPVNQTSVIFHQATNRQAGWTFGVPDSFAAMIWAKAYSEYLADNKKLVKALAQFAWKVTQTSKSAVTNTAAKVSERGTAGTAVMPAGADLNALPRVGSDVDFNKGQALAALVAASLGVSVIALIASPGAAGGSYGAAQTLDFPTIRVMESIQDNWTLFFTEVLAAIRVSDPKVEFPSIESDPVYRALESVNMLMESGVLWPAEARQFALDLLDIRDPMVGLPPKPEPTTANTTPSQGNTGSGKPASSDITNHDNDGE